MAINWSIIIATVSGAGIGLVGQWLGNLGARGRETRAYDRAREEWERQHRETLAAEREQRIRDDERAAVHAIVRGFQDHVVGPAGTVTPDRDFVMSLVKIIAYQRLHIQDPDLRRALGQAAEILEMFGLDPPPGYSGPIIIWVVRVTVLRWLGAFLREEPMPDPPRDWQVFRDRLADAVAETRKVLDSRGIQVSDFRFPSDFY